MPPPGALRDRYPAGSIDSAERADAALATTSGAKSRVEKAFAADARACLQRVLVNACIDEARQLQRRRLAEIDSIELEANRWKRRDRADRLDAGRAKRESERTENQPADAELRARNRKAFEERQVEAARDAATARAKASRAAAGEPGRKRPSTIRMPAAPATEAALDERAKNAAEHATKVAEAEAHRKDIDRRLARNAADRKRRDDEKAAKDARSAAAAAPAAPASR